MGRLCHVIICALVFSFAPLSGQENARPASPAQNGGRGAAAAGVQHQLVLPAGWNMISSYVYPAHPFLTEMLAGIEEHLTLLKDGKGRIYWPAYGINKIIFWEKEKGYQIYVTAPVTLLFDGEELVPEEVPISLLSGWNLISYVRTSPLAPAVALSSISSSLVIVKDGKGRIYWPAYNIDSIIEMKPGEGYYLYLTQPALFYYPSNGAEAGRASHAAGRHFPDPLHFHPFRSNTGSNAILLISAPGLADGDEIAACTEERRIVGSGAVRNGEALLVLWGDDETTRLVDGARGDELLSLISWSARTGAELPVQCTSLRDAMPPNRRLSALRFHDHAVLTAETPALARAPEQAELAQNYPNPFNSSTLLLYQLPEGGLMDLAVYDLRGRRVRTLANGVKPAGYYEAVWDGRSDAGIPLPSGLFWAVMRAGGYHQQVKMTLVK